MAMRMTNHFFNYAGAVTEDLSKPLHARIYNNQTRLLIERWDEDRRHENAIADMERRYMEESDRIELDSQVRHDLLTSLRMIYAPLPRHRRKA